MTPHISDFFPPRPAAIEDFYPGGIIRATPPKPPQRIGPDAAAVLIALTERLKGAAEVEMELLTIMQFCETVLRSCGVKMKVIYEPILPGAERGA